MTYKVFKDGDSWCAIRDDFVNLQVSPAGFGDTPVAAVDALLKEIVTIPEARAAYQREFKRDPDWKRTYIDNIACCLMDRGILKSDKVERDNLSEHILDTLFKE